MQIKFGGVVTKDNDELKELTLEAVDYINAAMTALRLRNPNVSSELILSAGFSGMINHITELAAHSDEPEQVLRDFATALTALPTIQGAKAKRRQILSGKCGCGKEH